MISSESECKVTTDRRTVIGLVPELAHLAAALADVSTARNAAVIPMTNA